MRTIELSTTEYEKIGEMLLELIADCPCLPAEIKENPAGLQYQSMGTGKCVGILTLPGAKYIGRDVTGGFTAQVNFRITCKGYSTDNHRRMEGQAVVDNILSWLEELENLPRLTGDRKITKITASGSYAGTDEADSDKSAVFMADAVMEYESKF